MNAWAHPTHHTKRHPDPISRFATIHMCGQTRVDDMVNHISALLSYSDSERRANNKNLSRMMPRLRKMRAVGRMLSKCKTPHFPGLPYSGSLSLLSWNLFPRDLMKFRSSFKAVIVRIWRVEPSASGGGGAHKLHYVRDLIVLFSSPSSFSRKTVQSTSTAVFKRTSRPNCTLGSWNWYLELVSQS